MKCSCGTEAIPGYIHCSECAYRLMQETREKAASKLKHQFAGQLTGTLKDTRKLSTGSLKLDRMLAGGIPYGCITEISGFEGSGKAQPVDTKVLTPSGWCRMGDIQPGDLVIGGDGKEHPISRIFPQGKKKTFTITFSDGSKTRCCKDHLWTVQTWKDKKENVYRTLPLHKIAKEYRAKDKRLIYSVPFVNPVEFRKKTLPLDPYILGLLLGDGSFVDSTIKISTADQEIIDSIKKYAKSTNQKIRHIARYDYSISKKIHGHKKSPIRITVESMGLAGLKSTKKFIPDIYLYSSVEDRTELLRGLLDTDGSPNKDGHYIEFTSASYKLAEGVEHLARSLGGRTTLCRRRVHYVDTTGKYIGKLAYRLIILFPPEIQPFKLKRKCQKKRPITFDHRARWVSNIQPYGIEECQCIFVDSPDHLYVTDDFIVTHNTTLALQIISQAQKQGIAVLIDTERSVNRELAVNLGVNLDRLLLAQPGTGYAAMELMYDIIMTGEVDCILIDSAAALSTKEEVEGGGRGDPDSWHPKLLYNSLRKMRGPIASGQIAVVFTNQMRERVGRGSVSSGGRALKQYSSLRLRLSRQDPIKKDDKRIGDRVVVDVIKSTVSPPHTKCGVDLIFGHGTSMAGDLIDMGLECKVVTSRASYYEYDGRLHRGREAFRDFLHSNPKIMEKLRSVV